MSVMTPDILPPRQLEILRLIAEGYDSYAIARELCLSRDTIKGYTKQLYRTLGARDRAHAVSIAYRKGILA